MDDAQKSLRYVTWVIAGTVVLLLGATIAISVFVTRSKAPRGLGKINSIYGEEISTIPTLSSRHVSQINSAALSSEGDPLLVPVFWNNEEGAFIIEIKLGKNWVALVVDTGSSHISAKGVDCKWKQCDGEICQETACPCAGNRGCNGTQFEPSGPQVGIDLNGDGTVTSESTLIYGSQQSSVTHYFESFEMYQLYLGCTDMVFETEFLNSRQLFKNLNPEGLHLVKFGPTTVHLVNKIQGTSTSNIFGLARGAEAGETVLLHSVFGKRPPLWSMVTTSERSGWIAFGALRCFGDPTYVPLVLPQEFKTFATQFYIVPVIAVYVNDRKVENNGTPRFIIADTGTTNSYGSTRFGSALGAVDWNEGISTVSFVVGDDNHICVLKYEPKDYYDPDGYYASSINVTKSRTLDNFDEMFNGVNVFLMGVRLMNNIYWEYDIANNRLGIIQL